MTGWIANGCPAVAVAEGWVWMTSWLAAAGLTTIGVGRRRGQAAGGELSVMVSALSSARFVKVATPPNTVAAVVPWSGPAPLFSAAVTTVLLSLVSRLPYWSSS